MCINYDSDYYRPGMCNDPTNSHGGCHNNSLFVEFRGERIDQEFLRDDSSGSWTIAPLLAYGMYPNLHMYHSYESFLPALHLYREKRRAFSKFILPSDFNNASHAKTVLKGYRELYGIELEIVRPHHQYCYDKLVLVLGTMAVQGSLGPMLQNILKQACDLPAERPVAKAPVMIYRRNPQMPGNIRFIANEIDIQNRLADAGIASFDWRLERTDTFCSQAKAIYTDVDCVVTIHGTHMTPLVLLKPGAVIIEVNPRQLNAAVFCTIGQGVGVRILSNKDGI